ncbi:hypothetical protein N7462_011249 [Penicillium macrosclerotiorum]|uniref:uncharacterized protein n=1 Tax=Penicillium macrosclerotiorum TaxID=303699 RepID=UPI0025470AD8|nr:uncharacterized protein N7462_011249 [Penicillium macrosclerotiorum]KAJ5666840.1 hypothetical protein N7462_011249 [Penicillium macrosclerotiorum]
MWDLPAPPRVSKTSTGAGQPASQSATSKYNASNGNQSSAATSPAPKGIMSGGGGHRSISPEFSVNPVNGTMSLSLPIYTSPGRSGLGPQLSLAYDSGSGNGAFGVGWQLSATAISRKVSKGVPRYNASDVFLLSGLEDLVPQGNPFTVGAYCVQQYRPQVETEVIRIESWTRTVNSDDIHWRTISGANVTTFFGETEDSRITDRDDTSLSGTRIFSWLISRTVDTAGNAMHYEYKAENSEGIAEQVTMRPLCEANRADAARTRMLYLKRIRYGNRDPSRDLDTWQIRRCADDWMFEVVFDYGEHDLEKPTPTEQQPWGIRAAPFSACNIGFELRTYRLCQRVLMFHHFPHETDRDHALVASTSFEYTESHGISLLRAATMTGWLPAVAPATGYYHESLPAVEFEYTPAALEDAVLEIQELPRDTVHQMSTTAAGSWRTEWVDLNGEGTPGALLIIENGAWWYQRNELPKQATDSFGPLRQLPLQPQGGAGDGQHYLEDLERSGRMDVVFLDATGVPTGFFERTVKDGWSPFQSLGSVPRLSLTDPFIKRVDLTGDGLPDLLHQDRSGRLVWYECLGKHGFAPAQPVTVAASYSDDLLPKLVSQDPARIGIYLADMTGDGFTDIVEVCQGRVRYWPNQGRGAFGAPVIMGDSPVFASITGEEFIPERLHLAGVFGAGTTDMLYLPAAGGLQVYINQAGNRWSKPLVLPQMPALTDVASAFTLDLLGRGTACLCWNDLARGTLKYIDLAGGTKPHLLRRYHNGMGAYRTVTYQPSTYFYLADEAAGTPWTTRLPFPVHCVSQITMQDHIAQTTHSTRYAYHNGRYDGVEREFCGFGVVEQWDEEVFGATQGAAYLRRLPIHTKQWFHTGAPSDTITANHQLHSAWPESSGGAGCHQLPFNLAPDEKYMVHRALKGQKLREEVYSDDGSRHVARPYYVSEFSHGVARHTAVAGCYRVVPRESVKIVYEREAAGIPPRIEREMALQVDEYGNVLRTLTVTQGRTSSVGAPARDEQAASWGIYTETSVTNAVIETHCFQTPQVASTRQYAVRGLADSQIIELDGLAATNCALLSALEEVPYHTVVEKGEEYVSRGPCKSLVGETRQYFYDSQLREPLQLGVIEPFSILERSYQLAFQRDTLLEQFVSTGLLNLEMLPTTMEQAGYVRLGDSEDDNDRWWTPSDQQQFATTQKDERLGLARRSFYQPTVVVDAFGGRTARVLDSHWYLPVETVNSMGHTTRFQNDYWHLQPCEITDINDNRTQIALDAFGSVVGTARLGKAHQKIGDSLEGFSVSVTAEELEIFIQEPTGEISTRLLASAGQRTLFYRGRYTPGDTTGQPSFIAELSCEVHGRESRANAALTISITYLDGTGQPLQTTRRCTHGPSPEQWRVSEWIIRDSRGNPVRICQPSFAADHLFRFEANIESPKTTQLLDPMDRAVGTLLADHTWSKLIPTPWSQVDYDALGTLFIADPALDEDLGQAFQGLPRSEYFPTWLKHPDRELPEQRAAATVQKCERLAGARTVTHRDARGNDILTEEILADGTRRCTRTQYNMAGHPVGQFDAAQRLVQRIHCDLSGRPLVTQAMDAGETIILPDCRGSPIFSWRQPGLRFRHVYDDLRREREVWLYDKDQEGAPDEILLHRLTYDEPFSSTATSDNDDNLQGQISYIEDQSGRLENTRFDFKGNCVAQAFSLAAHYHGVLDWSRPVALENDGKPYISLSAFDALGRQVESVDFVGGITSRTYNLLGQVESVSTQSAEQPVADQLVSKIAYSADEMPLSIAYGNGTLLDHRYDERTRRLLQKRLLSSSGPRIRAIQDIHTTYDCVGRMVRKWDAAKDPAYFRNSQTKAEWTYSYDSFGQLCEATGREQLNACNGGGYRLEPHRPQGRPPVRGAQQCQYREQYAYDNVGNLLSMRHEALNQPSIAGWSRRYEYNEPSLLQPGVMGNRLTQTSTGHGQYEVYGYGSSRAGRRGCITTMAGYSNLTWDYKDQLRSTAQQITKSEDGQPERTWYVYNLEGMRVRKVTERGISSKADPRPPKLKETLYLAGVEVYHKFAGDGMRVIKKTISTTIDCGAAKLVREQKLIGISTSTSKLLRYQTGENLELDDAGRVISYEEYTPFGTTVCAAQAQEVSAPRKYRYAAYERDRETGLYYCHRRYYATWLVRWLSPDPIGILDGLNIYLYCANDPVNRIDPTGTMKDSLSGNPKNPLSGKRSKNLDIEKAMDTTKIKIDGLDQVKSSQSESIQKGVENTNGPASNNEGGLTLIDKSKLPKLNPCARFCRCIGPTTKANASQHSFIARVLATFSTKRQLAGYAVGVKVNLHEANDKIKKRDEQIVNLQKDFAIAKEETREAKLESLMLQKDVSKLRQILAGANLKNQQKERQLNEADAEISELRAKLEQAQEQNGILDRGKIIMDTRSQQPDRWAETWIEIL